jgi:hypothetical protein
MKKILIFGSTSAIAEATARLWAQDGNRLFLVARDAERVAIQCRDLVIRGAESANHAVLDLNDFDRHKQAIEEAAKTLEGVDIALIAHGSLGDQKSCEHSFEHTLKELNTNAISVISLSTHLANLFERQKQGTLAVISSVAGDRARQSNYVYGSAKGMVSLFMQGIRNRLHRSGIRVITIKPGMVDTPMTSALRKGLLWTTPETIAKDIYSGIAKGRDVVYTPVYWKLIMKIINSIPESVFKKTRL